jgi:predicted secreted Zn-dependent protease
MKILMLLFWALLLSVWHPVQHNTLIDWKADYKLNWGDFKARPDANSPNAALTSTAIKFDFSYNDGNLKFHTRCQFDKSISWGRVKNDYILSHEQGHFDITEIHARKLNKALKEYTVDNANNVSRDLNKIYEKTMRELHNMQTAYDAATDFSINHDKQNEWLKKISDELKELKNFENYN